MPHSDMREPTFLILASLAGGAQHGYGIMSEVDQISDGRVALRAGTLYTALDRLTDEGLIAEAGTEIVEGRLRKYYELTEVGVEALDAEVVRLRSNANKAATRLRARAART